jgi:hypothetical protein
MRRGWIIWYARLGLCAGLLRFCALAVLVIGGCTEWTIPACEGTPPKTPCVGECTIPLEPVGQAFTSATVPLAVVIQDEQGTFHCQQIKP